MEPMMELVGGCDIGNGYVKAQIARAVNGTYEVDEIDIPSGVTVVTHSTHLPLPASEAVTEMRAGAEMSIYNRLDATFTSPLVTDERHRLFGSRSMTSGGAFREFDVMGKLSKAEQQISSELVLACFAARALKSYVGEHGRLPATGEVIDVNAHVALALPIDEYLEHRSMFAAKFRNDSQPHQVRIHNFETVVSVNITFAGENSVQVLPEGATGQFAIVDYGVPLMDMMLSDVRSRGIKLDGITAEDVLAAEHVIDLDIGEGTMNKSVFTFGNFNADASSSFAKGYGSVLTAAMEAMESDHVNSFSSRKQLAAFLRKAPSAMKRHTYEMVKSYVDDQIDFYTDEAAEQFGRTLSVVGAMNEVVFVYGGGSAPVRESLYPKLLAKVAEMSGQHDAMPILYLNADYSRNLNREGLYSAATKVYALRHPEYALPEVTR